MREALRDENGRPLRYHAYERMVNGRRVELRFALVEGRLVCVGVEIGPPILRNENANAEVFDVVDDSELEPLRSTEIRLRLRDLVDEALTHAVATLITGLPPDMAARLEEHRAVAETSRPRSPGRPPLYGDDHYQEVARIYEDTLRSGRRDPLRAIMSALKVEKTAAASKVREARRRGFLTIEY